MQIIFRALEKLKKRIDDPRITFSIKGSDLFECTVMGSYGSHDKSSFPTNEKYYVTAHHMMSLTQFSFSYQVKDAMEYLLDMTMDKLISYLDKEELQQEKKPLPGQE